MDRSPGGVQSQSVMLSDSHLRFNLKCYNHRHLKKDHKGNEELHANNMDNLKKMDKFFKRYNLQDKFLKRYNLLRPIQEEIENMNT